MRVRKLRRKQSRRANEVVVPLQRAQLADTSHQRHAHGQAQTLQELTPIEINRESIDINAIRHDRKLTIADDSLRAKLSPHCVRHGDHTMRPRECVAMQPAELKQHVPRHDELRLTVTTRSVSSERVVACRMRMNDVDRVARDEPGEFVRARHVERVTQRQRLDMRAFDLQVTDQRRVWTHDGVEVVTARDERVGEIGNVTLTAAE